MQKIDVTPKCHRVRETDKFQIPADLGYHPFYAQETWWYVSNLIDSYSNRIGVVCLTTKLSQCLPYTDIFLAAVVITNATSNTSQIYNATYCLSEVKMTPEYVNFGLWSAASTTSGVMLKTLLDETNVNLQVDGGSYFRYGTQGTTRVCNTSDCLGVGITYPTLPSRGYVNNIPVKGVTLLDKAYSSIATRIRPWSWIGLRFGPYALWYWQFFRSNYSNGNLYDFRDGTTTYLNSQACDFIHRNPWVSPRSNFTYHLNITMRCFTSQLQGDTYVIHTNVADNEIQWALPPGPGYVYEAPCTITGRYSGDGILEYALN